MASLDSAWLWLPRGLLLAGSALRVLAVVHLPLPSDAAKYTVLAKSILEGRGMWLPWGEYWELDAWRAGPSHH